MIAALNVLALLLSCLAAHLAPAATLILAYAALGPLHYLTEISWLHDRRYFVARPAWLVVGTIVGVVGGFVMSDAAGVVAIAVGGACVAAGVGCRAIGVTAAMLATGVVAGLGVWAGWWWVLAAVVLVPTLIHVFAMTAMFVVAGAIRAKSRREWAVVGCLALCSASFALVPCVDLAGGMMFERAAELFGEVFAVLGVRGVDAASALLGFTAFAYAYHYLNWFLKARTIGWATMTTERKVLLGAVWGVIACAYVIDVRLGLLVSIPLSFGHVLLEMPLNVSVARRLFGSAGHGMRSPTPTVG
jgi:hypothetical protein